MHGGASRQPLAHAAAENIGRRIVAGHFVPGSALPKLETLAAEFSVSRLSMREAIKLLAGKGLVHSRPRRGTVVRPHSEWSRLDPDILVWQFDGPPSAAFIRNLFEMRSIIEPEAAALVASRASVDVIATIEVALAAMAAAEPLSIESIEADVAFHQAILTGTGNEFIAAFAPVIAASLRTTFRVQRRALRDSDHFIPRHRAIFEAMKRGDGEDARGAFHALLRQAEADAMAGIKVRGE